MDINYILRNGALFVAFLLGIYNILIWIRILLSWFHSPGASFNSPLVNTLSRVVDPYLNMFKNTNALRTKNLDFSPLLALAVLSIIQSLLQVFGQTGTLTINYTLALIVKTIYSYLISPLFFITILLLIVRLVLCYKRTPNAMAVSRMIESIIGKLLNWVQKNIFGSRLIANRTLITVTLVLTGILYFLVRLGVIKLMNYLLN